MVTAFAILAMFFCDASFPAKNFSEFYHTLTANNFGLKTLNLENYHIFRMLWMSAFKWYRPECDVPVPGIFHFLVVLEPVREENLNRKKVSEPVMEKISIGKKSQSR